MIAKNRKALLLLTLAGVVGFAVFAPAIERPAGSPPPRPSAPTSKVMDSTMPVGAIVTDGSRLGVFSELPERGTLGGSKVDLFGQQSWQPPPPKVVVSPPRLPSPPPMSYRFAGRLLQDGKLQVFVSKGDTPIAIKVGDTLEEGYVVEAITTEAITLIYPSLGHRASIAIPLITSATGSTPPSNTMVAPTGLGALPAQAVVNQPASSTQAQRHISTPSNPASRPQ
jgi:hypothetical protein